MAEETLGGRPRVREGIILFYFFKKTLLGSGKMAQSAKFWPGEYKDLSLTLRHPHLKKKKTSCGGRNPSYQHLDAQMRGPWGISGHLV